MSEVENAAALAAPPAADATASFWLAEIAAAKRSYKKWQDRGDKVIQRYKDEQNDQDTNVLKRGKRLNLLWSNVETIKPALYSQTPTPNVSRRNKDEDPVGRWASIVLERCVEASLGTQAGMETFDDVMASVRDDLLLPGQGIAIEEYVAEVGEDNAVTNQRSKSRYIHWKDWLTNVCRMWSEVWWFGYRSYLTREEAEDKWGEDLAKQLAYTHKPTDTEGASQQNAELNDQAVIWTIWSRRHGQIFIVAEGFGTQTLDTLPPPVKFEGFWPFPKPVQATVAKDSILPVPDFVFYQDQADTIDQLVNRIAKLSESLRLRGLYPADMDSIKRLLQDASDTEMIPIENWAMLSERGGADGLVVWFPLKEVAAALISAMQALKEQKDMLYEVTGISDIVRGASEASETATAQQIKGQWGSLRIRPRQRAIQAFARDLISLKAQIIAEHFNQQTLAEMSGVQLLTAQQKQGVMAWQQQGQAVMAQYQAMTQHAMLPQGQPPPPPPQPTPPPIPQAMLPLAQEPTWDDVIGLLRNNKLRGFVIDVETDSTVEPDQMAEQKKAVEFVGAATQYMTAALPILQAEPMAAPMLGEFLLFAARRFKVGETLETSIEKFTQQVSQAAGSPKPPDPKVQVAQIGVGVAQMKGQAEQQKAQLGVMQAVAEHKAGMQELGMEMQQSAQEHQQAIAEGQQRMAEQAQAPVPQ